ncbi:MAG: hypothetical protein NZ842_19055 [Dehalococcoidia bacterium]|nr:hypothetical protein [Dehalococcoidia bacterium]
MKDNAQLLLVSGLLMSITIIAVSSTITHSVNMGYHQGERHDLTPLLSSIEDDFPLALEYKVDNAAADTSLPASFNTTSETFESLFASRGYSLSFTLVSSLEEDSGTHTFVYSFAINDGTMYVSLDQTISF